MTSHQPKKTILLSVIIVSYNTAKLTLATLESLANDLQASSLQEMSEIFIVDNNSKDDTVSQIKNWRSKRLLLNLLTLNSMSSKTKTI